MAREPRQASANDVRQWAIDNDWTDANGNAVGERGRFSTELITDFNKAHKRNNLSYQGGGTSPSQGRSTAVATRTQSNTGNSRNTAATRQTRQAPTREAAPTRPVESVGSAMRVVQGEGGVSEMVREVIGMLSSASNVGGKKGEPILLHVEGYRLAYADAS